MVQERLTIVWPPDLGQQLAVAVHRLCTAPLGISVPGLSALTARLASGDFEAVRAALRSAGPVPALPLALARYVRWSGDLQTAAGLWSVAQDALDGVAAADPVLRRATYAELPATATDLGEVHLAARLHSLARRQSTVIASAAAADPDTRLILNAAFDVLGLDPDATRGRLTLRPRLDVQHELDARHIRFGDGSVSMSAVHEDGDIVIRIEQNAGSIPVTALLEPFVAQVAGAEVDGAPAELDVRIVDARTSVAVQLVLDHVRTLRIRGGGSVRDKKGAATRGGGP